MSWIAKPSGGYNTADQHINMLEVYGILNSLGWSVGAVAGLLGSFVAESGMNPWRWQEDRVDYNAGYGLAQFTPASDYINLTGQQFHSPNLSVSSITQGATPEDGACQTYVVANDVLGKWTGVGWRSYWDKDAYPDAWARYQDMRTRYTFPMAYSTYKNWPRHNIFDAAFIFMASFEGPKRGDRDYRTYEEAAASAYRYITGQDPPDPPVPPTPTGRKLPLFFYLRYPF